MLGVCTAARSARRQQVCLLTIAACCCATACSSSKVSENRKPVHPVKGKVLVQGWPAAGAFVLFTPVNEPPEAPDPRPRAETQQDGSFVAFTYDANDGAPVGEYKVTVMWPGREESDRLRGRYADSGTTRLRATVKEGPNELPPFELR